MYWSTVFFCAKCISLKWRNVFNGNCKLVSSQIAKLCCIAICFGIFRILSEIVNDQFSLGIFGLLSSLVTLYIFYFAGCASPQTSQIPFFESFKATPKLFWSGFSHFFSSKTCFRETLSSSPTFQNHRTQGCKLRKLL